MSVLPADPVLLEQSLRAAIADTLLSVPLIAQWVNVEKRERFAGDDDEDAAISTKPDPSNPNDLAITSIIQIGMPVVRETEYAGGCATSLEFTYPITFDMSVRDLWDNTDNTLQFTNSSDLAIAVYMSGRDKFKQNRDFGYSNCQHQFLQQENTQSVYDEETDRTMHVFDWSITIRVTGVI